ncbi:hypothetical protein MCHI_002887 [Candidatus Magnetoovum chiemensis]|nr:hypothetical protein MCHI_002887 [Candidatus Magnetoovum chiemensis]
MKIHSVKFDRTKSGLKIERIYLSDLVLFVGASGVGKSVILDAIFDLQRIASGTSLNGVEWEVEFSIDDTTKRYVWTGAFEKVDKRDLTEEKYRVDYEKLRLDGEILVERKGNEITFAGKPTPKLSSTESVIYIFVEDENVALVNKEFRKIVKSTGIIPSENNYGGIYVSGYGYSGNIEKQTWELESIRNDNLPIDRKLFLIFENQREVFNEIKNSFIDVFTQVEDVKLVNPKERADDVIYLYIKEKNAPEWIPQEHISSGMYKTLMQISELYLCADGSVILIDEFENSLGINCLDSVVDNLIFNRRDLQFIITSHHPYVINNINFEAWKIVQRRRDVVYTKDAKDYRLGESKHEAFMQLIQLDDYVEGVKIE